MSDLVLYMDKVIFGSMVGSDKVGYYENSERVIKIPLANSLKIHYDKTITCNWRISGSTTGEHVFS